MKIFFTSISCYILILFSSCTSPQKLYDNGQYDKAFYAAINDLKKNPDNTKAQAVLPNALQQYLTKINDDLTYQRQHNAQPEALYNSYSELQRVYEAIRTTPGAQKLVSARNYSEELAEAANTAAGYFYENGLSQLQRGDKKSAQQAYENFKKSQSYVKDFKDVGQKITEAEELAFTNVIVNTIDQRFGYYSIDGGFLKNDIMRELSYAGASHYYIFYEINRSGNLRADQFMDIALYDIWIGQLNSSSYSYDVSKNIETTSDTGNRKKITITVKARINVTRRIIDSRAMMDCRITDAESRRMLYTERFPVQYTWENLSGNYSGDSRALSDKDWAIIKGVYNNAPTQDELYRELTRKMLRDFSSRMRQIYSN